MSYIPYIPYVPYIAKGFPRSLVIYLKNYIPIIE